MKQIEEVTRAQYPRRVCNPLTHDHSGTTESFQREENLYVSNGCIDKDSIHCLHYYTLCRNSKCIDVLGMTSTEQLSNNIGKKWPSYNNNTQGRKLKESIKICDVLDKNT